MSNPSSKTKVKVQINYGHGWDKFFDSIGVLGSGGNNIPYHSEVQFNQSPHPSTSQLTSKSIITAPYNSKSPAPTNNMDHRKPSQSHSMTSPTPIPPSRTKSRSSSGTGSSSHESTNGSPPTPPLFGGTQDNNITKIPRNYEYLFGRCPGSESFVVIKCKYCHRMIKLQHIEAHVLECDLVPMQFKTLVKPVESPFFTAGQILMPFPNQPVRPQFQQPYLPTPKPQPSDPTREIHLPTRSLLPGQGSQIRRELLSQSPGNPATPPTLSKEATTSNHHRHHHHHKEKPPKENESDSQTVPSCTSFPDFPYDHAKFDHMERPPTPGATLFPSTDSNDSHSSCGSIENATEILNSMPKLKPSAPLPGLIPSSIPSPKPRKSKAEEPDFHGSLADKPPKTQHPARIGNPQPAPSTTLGRPIPTHKILPPLPKPSLPLVKINPTNGSDSGIGAAGTKIRISNSQIINSRPIMSSQPKSLLTETGTPKTQTDKDKKGSGSTGSKTATKKGSLKERKYDPDSHCGVDLGDGSVCKRSLTCKSHSINLKRSVPGRSQIVDILLAQNKKAREETKGTKSGGSKDSLIGILSASTSPQISTPPGSPGFLPPSPIISKISGKMAIQKSLSQPLESFKSKIPTTMYKGDKPLQSSAKLLTQGQSTKSSAATDSSPKSTTESKSQSQSLDSSKKAPQLKSQAEQNLKSLTMGKPAKPKQMPMAPPPPPPRKPIATTTQISHTSTALGQDILARSAKTKIPSQHQVLKQQSESPLPELRKPKTVSIGTSTLPFKPQNPPQSNNTRKHLKSAWAQPEQITLFTQNQPKKPKYITILTDKEKAELLLASKTKLKSIPTTQSKKENYYGPVPDSTYHTIQRIKQQILQRRRRKEQLLAQEKAGGPPCPEKPPTSLQLKIRMIKQRIKQRLGIGQIKESHHDHRHKTSKSSQKSNETQEQQKLKKTTALQKDSKTPGTVVKEGRSHKHKDHLHKHKTSSKKSKSHDKGKLLSGSSSSSLLGKIPNDKHATVNIEPGSLPAHSSVKTLTKLKSKESNKLKKKTKKDSHSKKHEQKSHKHKSKRSRHKKSNATKDEPHVHRQGPEQRPKQKLYHGTGDLKINPYLTKKSPAKPGNSAETFTFHDLELDSPPRKTSYKPLTFKTGILFHHPQSNTTMYIPPFKRVKLSNSNPVRQAPPQPLAASIPCSSEQSLPQALPPVPKLTLPTQYVFLKQDLSGTDPIYLIPSSSTNPTTPTANVIHTFGPGELDELLGNTATSTTAFLPTLADRNGNPIQYANTYAVSNTTVEQYQESGVQHFRIMNPQVLSLDQLQPHQNTSDQTNGNYDQVQFRMNPFN